MKCLIVLTLVAACSAYTFPSGWGSSRNFRVNPDGSITVSSTDGRVITISRSTGPDRSAIITQYQSRYQPSQVDDSLVRLLENYQGDIDQDAYQQLLEDVRCAVEAGQVRRTVYEALQNLDQAQSQVGQSQLGRLSGQPQFWQKLQQLQQQYPRDIVRPSPYTSYLRDFGYQGGRTWNQFTNSLGYASRQQSVYSPQVQLLQAIQGEREILDQQDQIQQQQLRQQVQQQQLLQQLWQQQQEQQQQQLQQQYIQKLQQQVEQEQEQVLAQQQRLRQEQEEQQRLQQQVPQQSGLRNWLGGARWFGGRNQQPYSWQQQPGTYSQGRYYGGYDQGLQRLVAPWVV